MSRSEDSPSRCLAMLLAATLLLAAGCRFLLYDEEGAPVGAHTDLHALPPLDLDAMAGEAPDTPPSSPGETAGAPPDRIELTLEQCRAAALRGNLRLKANVLSPAMAAEAVREAEARFEPLYFSEMHYARSDVAGVSLGPNEDQIVANLEAFGVDPTELTFLGGQVGEELGFAPGVEVPFSTGGGLRLEMPFTARKRETRFDDSESYMANVKLSLYQPLLRGAGRGVNRAPIRIARVEHEKSEALVRLEVTAVLAAVDRLYWQLHAAREELEVRRQESELAEALLAQARRLVQAGVATEIEILRASLGVAERAEAVLIAENRLRERTRDLKRILQMPGMGMDSHTAVEPVSAPRVGHLSPDPRRVYEFALGNRMELLALELDILRESITAETNRNETLPLVALAYSYNASGDGSAMADAFDMLFDKREEDHRLGLRVEIPLGNQAARSRLRRTLLSRLQLLSRQEDRRSSIKQEVCNSLDRLEVAYQRMLAARKQVAHAERLAAAEKRQFEQGLNTSTDVLEAQTRLANARSAGIRAVADYQISQVDVAVASGTLLGADQIRWGRGAPEPAPPFQPTPVAW